MTSNVEDLNWFRILFFVFAGFLAIMIFNKVIFPSPEQVATFPYGVIIVFGFFIATALVQAIDWRSRYGHHRHVTVDGFSGSFKRYHLVPDKSIHPDFKWMVISTGYSEHPFPTEGKLATLIVPAKQVIESGDNLVGVTHVNKTDVVPHVVSAFFRRYKGDFNVENVWYGRYSRRFRDLSGVDEDLVTEVESLNHLVDQYRKHQKRDFGSVQEFVNISEKLLRKRGVASIVREKIREKPEDE